MKGTAFVKLLILLLPLLNPFCSLAQTGGDTAKIVPNGTDGLDLNKRPKDSLIKTLLPNEFEGQFSTFRIGFGYIGDFTTYKTNDVFNRQMDTAGIVLTPQFQTRDARILGSGVLTTKRSISWKFAYMYDGNQKYWLVRETGITVGLPEIKSHIFIGRTKEGYSMVKVMNGHSPWGYERMMALDVIPIMADGVKVFGFDDRSKIFWNLGYFNDIVSKGQGFSTFAWQGVARIGWVPVNDPKKGKTLHIAGNFRYGKPLDGKMTLKSRPESNNTPFLISTGSFAADYSTHLGGEIFYSAHRFVIGSEIAIHSFYKTGGTNHTFYGGNVMLAYSITGGKRPYKTAGNIFGFMPVRKSILQKGTGEIELAIFLSTLNLNDQSIAGGQMWRLTPMINWYPLKYMRVEFIYGYGILDRYNLQGAIQFFESRIQFTIM